MAGQVDYLLKLEGIDGESADAKLAKHIHIDSWSMGVTNAVSIDTGGGPMTGSPVSRVAWMQWREARLRAVAATPGNLSLVSYQPVLQEPAPIEVIETQEASPREAPPRPEGGGSESPR